MGKQLSPQVTIGAIVAAVVLVALVIFMVNKSAQDREMTPVPHSANAGANSPSNGVSVGGNNLRRNMNAGASTKAATE